jgi:hypothetical protein
MSEVHDANAVPAENRGGIHDPESAAVAMVVGAVFVAVVAAFVLGSALCRSHPKAVAAAVAIVAAATWLLAVF